LNRKTEEDQAPLEFPIYSTSEPEKAKPPENNGDPAANDTEGSWAMIDPLPSTEDPQRIAKDSSSLTNASSPRTRQPLENSALPAGQEDASRPGDQPWPASPVLDTEEPTAEEAADSGPGGWAVAKAVIREIVETVVLTLIIFFLIQLVIRNFRVDGHSMDPNLQHGQYLVVDKISYNLPFHWRVPERGDVVVFEPPTYPDKDFVKRIIGLPGETIEIRQGQVYINNERFQEPFGARIDRFSMPSRTIPEGEYFVMGDNRANSNDSRNWGPLEDDKIVGRAWLSYWPPETWGVILKDGPTNSATLLHWIGQLIGGETS